MANFYWIKISDKGVTQEMASETFNLLAKSCFVRSFEYIDGVCVSYNTRGLVDIGNILEKYEIEHIEIEDEFSRSFNV